MRLAMALGRTVDELLDEVSSRELSEYAALRHLELLPNERVELLLATLIAVTINVHRDPEKGEPVEALDFLPWLQDDDDDETDEKGTDDMVAMIEMLNTAFGGVDLREKAGDG